MNESVKIVVSCHAYRPTLPPDLFELIHAGRAIAANALPDIRGDDSGENISAKNRSYCELTAIYWAWKNLSELDNPDYVGLFHYRRLFDLISTDPVIRDFHNFSSKTIKRFGWSADLASKVCTGYDLILPYSEQLVNKMNRPTSLVGNYGEYHHQEDIELAIDIVKARYPAHITAINSAVNGRASYRYNMFIMKRELFSRYAEFIFSILSEVEAQIDMSKYEDDYQRRVFGFLAERLMNIFIAIENDIKPLKIKEVPVVYGQFNTSFKARVRRSLIYWAKRAGVRLFHSEKYVEIGIGKWLLWQRWR
ncbi:MAG: DUF4422 domain-containing protein [Deferribacteraceae bacterium]|jgi:hypothetical protein|nr:DUF4422 domain-containing protein [Deferribacteraceae bacterium]